jgi:hypothetical protein
MFIFLVMIAIFKISNWFTLLGFITHIYLSIINLIQVLVSLHTIMVLLRIFISFLTLYASMQVVITRGLVVTFKLAGRLKCFWHKCNSEGLVWMLDRVIGMVLALLLIAIFFLMKMIG